MVTNVKSAGLKRQEPGVARDRQIARIEGKLSQIDLDNLPDVLSGDIWEFGDHRLLCGDCTNPDDVEAVTEGALVALVVCDPPYNVAYTGKKLIRKAIKNDNLKEAEFLSFLTAAFRAIPLKPGGAFYICAPAGRTVATFYTAASAAGLEVHQTLIWAKNHFVLGRSDYHAKHENIIYGWRPGAAHYFGGGRKQHSVWSFDKPLKSPLHPTTKPVALMQRAIENSSREGETVFDGFVGSGSTLIACEMAGRRCVAIEIDRRYCGVVIARWAALTGREARLVRRIEKTTDPTPAILTTAKEDKQ